MEESDENQRTIINETLSSSLLQPNNNVSVSDESNTFPESNIINGSNNTVEEEKLHHDSIVYCSCCTNPVENNVQLVKQEIFDEDIDENEDQNLSETVFENSTSSSASNIMTKRRRIKSIKTARDQIKNILEVLFEYPYIARQDKTVFGSIEHDEDFPLCIKCLDILHTLFPIYCEFTNLLKQEGKIWKTIQKIGYENDPILPMLVYEDSNSRKKKKQRNRKRNITSRKTTTNNNEIRVSSPLRRSRRQTIRNGVFSSEGLSKQSQSLTDTNEVTKTTTTLASLPRLRLRKSNIKSSSSRIGLNTNNNSHSLPRKIRIKLFSEDEESSSAHNSDENEYGEEEEEELDHEEPIGFSDDESFDSNSITNNNNRTTSKHVSHRLGEMNKEQRAKRGRGRPPKQRLSNQVTLDKNIEQNSTNAISTSLNNDEKQATVPLKKKKIRIRPNRRKEVWIQKAKNDPSRTCSICGKSFLYARFMQHHKATVHEGKRPYECDYCGKAFTQKFIVKKHLCDYNRCTPEEREQLIMLREQKLRMYSCEICDKRFKEKCHLNVHKLNHREDRPFICQEPDCNKSFRRKDHLRMHVRVVHTLERQFVCSLCGKSFKISSNLRAHEKRHRTPDEKGDEKHICTVCGKSFDSLSLVNRHQMTHEEFTVLPYQCPICGKRFKMKDYLGQHLRKGKTCKLPKKTNLNALLAKANTNNQQSTSSLDIIPMQEAPSPLTSDVSVVITNPHQTTLLTSTTTNFTLSAVNLDLSKENSNHSQTIEVVSSLSTDQNNISTLPTIPGVPTLHNIQYSIPYHQAVFENPYRTQ